MAPITRSTNRDDASAESAEAPSVDRAMEALEQAARAAETGSAPGELVRVSSADVLGLAKLDPRAARGRLDRLVLGGDPELGLDTLLDNGALAALFPEVHALVGFGDGEWRHKDVWKHTKQVVRQATCRLEVRWAALFHDVGKVKTRSIAPDGTVHFLGHAEVGTRMFERGERRLGLFSSSDDAALKESVRFLILHHLRANQYETGWTDSAVRRFARELGAHLGDLFCLSEADITTKRPEKKRRGLAQLEELRERIATLAAEDAKLPPLPGGIGDEIMQAFSLRPSRLIGDLKRALEAAIESGELAPREESAVYLAWLAERRAGLGF